MTARAGEALKSDSTAASIYVAVYKLVLGIAELSIGIALAAFGPHLYWWIEPRLLEELSESPHDLIARMAVQALPALLTRHTFIVVSLIILGVAKMAGAIGLLYGRNWGVDLLVGLTVLMAPFQIMSLLLHPNLIDLLYFSVGLAIALYLIEFRPKAWISRVLQLS